MAERVLLRICDYIFVTRPLILTPAWSFFLLGAREGSRELAPASTGYLVPGVDSLLSLTFILVTAYIINQIFDRETDRVNRKVFFLAEGLFGVRRMVLMALLYFLAASYFFHRTADVQRTILLAALVLSLVYSLPPMRLCARPFLDLLANGFGYGGLAFLLGYSESGAGLFAGALASLPYVLMVSGIFVYTALLDMEGDAKTGKHSTATKLGEERAGTLASVLLVLAPPAAVVTGNIYAVPITALVAALGVYIHFKRSARRTAFAVQASTLMVILAACAVWPVYFLVVVPLVVLARYYYGRRFGIIYPGVRSGS